MIKSTVCYLVHDEKWLMLLRNKKQHDLNHGKWIGVGGKLKRISSTICVILWYHSFSLWTSWRWRNLCISNQWLCWYSTWMQRGYTGIYTKEGYFRFRTLGRRSHLPRENVSKRSSIFNSFILWRKWDTY